MTQRNAAGPSRVVALDGPSGSGKSTVARGVARVLGWRYLDTGATYRAATLAVLRAGADPSDSSAVVDAVHEARIEVRTDPDQPGVALDGEDVAAAIRAADVTAAVSAVSAVSEVRALLVARQQELIGDGEVVVEGRDICAVVAPAALVKVYLDADPLVRAARRAGDSDAGVVVTGPPGAPQATAEALVATVAADLARRDALDSSRTTSPLEAAADAVHIDASHLGADEVVAAVLALVDNAGLRQ